MKLPGFIALASDSQSVVARTLSGGSAVNRAGFICSETSCICVGDADCNDLFSTNLCKTTGPWGKVDGSCTGRVCVCRRAPRF